MNTEISGIVLMFSITVLLAVPLGRYIAKIFCNKKTWLDVIFDPVDRLLYTWGGIDPLKP